MWLLTIFVPQFHLIRERLARKRRSPGYDHHSSVALYTNSDLRKVAVHFTLASSLLCGLYCRDLDLIPYRLSGSLSCL